MGFRVYRVYRAFMVYRAYRVYKVWGLGFRVFEWRSGSRVRNCRGFEV